jgi:DNA-binding NarL/FixJ family response regulator
MGNPIANILIVEDEPLVRSLLASVLETEGFQIKQAGGAAEARSVTKSFEPQVAILDIELGDGPSGIDLAHILRLEFPNIGIVFLTHIPEPRIAGVENRSLPKDVAYLRKDRLGDAAVLKRAITEAAQGRVSKSLREDKIGEHDLVNASRSQLEVLRMVSMGLSNQEIAERRGTTVRAVEHLVKRAFATVGVEPSRTSNARVAAARSFISVAGVPHER